MYTVYTHTFPFISIWIHLQRDTICIKSTYPSHGVPPTGGQLMLAQHPTAHPPMWRWDPSVDLMYLQQCWAQGRQQLQVDDHHHDCWNIPRLIEHKCVGSRGNYAAMELLKSKEWYQFALCGLLYSVVMSESFSMKFQVPFFQKPAAHRTN